MSARESQDLILVVTQSTGSKSRLPQDLILAPLLPTTAKVRDSQEVLLVVTKRPANAHAFVQKQCSQNAF